MLQREETSAAGYNRGEKEAVFSSPLTSPHTSGNHGNETLMRKPESLEPRHGGRAEQWRGTWDKWRHWEQHETGALVSLKLGLEAGMAEDLNGPGTQGMTHMVPIR